MVWSNSIINTSANIFRLSTWLMEMWQKVTGLAVLEGLWNINHSLALSHYWSTRGLLAAGLPPWPDSPFIRQPGPAQLPGQDHIEANLSADARSTWAGETQDSPPQDFHSNWPPSSWITRACQSSRSWGLVFFIVANWSNVLFLWQNNGDMGDRTPGLSHAKRTLYHWATSPARFVCTTCSKRLKQRGPALPEAKQLKYPRGDSNPQSSV